MIAASILKKNGIHGFYDVKGGYNSIKNASLKHIKTDKLA